MYVQYTLKIVFFKQADLRHLTTLCEVGLECTTVVTSTRFQAILLPHLISFTENTRHINM